MNELTPRIWFRSTLIAVTSILTLIALTIVILDPYFHYHQPIDGMSYRLSDERYINNGIIKHFDYDSIITGTSMSQNFKTSEFDRLLNVNSVKIPYSGAGYKELSENIDTALKLRPDTNLVLILLDYNGLIRPWDWERFNEYPTYLNDDNLFNDSPYLWNKDVLYHGLAPNIEMTLRGLPSTSFDEYSSWEYRPDAWKLVLSTEDRKNFKNIANTGIDVLTKEDISIVTDTISKNIISLANRYPNTTFIIPYTPYSIWYWEAIMLENKFEKQLQAETLANSMMLECPNIKLYSFFDMETISNIDLYIDRGHYKSEVNSLIIEWIKEEKGLVTKENNVDLIEFKRQALLKFDYNSTYTY